MELILPQLGLFFWTALLFLAIFMLLRRFAWKPILGMIHEREQNIENSLLEAQRAREEMSKMKAENEELLRLARQERDQMLRDAGQTAEQIISKAREGAAIAAARETEKAKQQIESEKNAALTEIKNTAGALAVDIAEKLLRKEFENRSAQEALANTLIADLSKN